MIVVGCAHPPPPLPAKLPIPPPPPPPSRQPPRPNSPPPPPKFWQIAGGVSHQDQLQSPPTGVITFPSLRLHWVMVNLGTESGKVIIKVVRRARAGQTLSQKIVVGSSSYQTHTGWHSAADIGGVACVQSKVHRRTAAGIVSIQLWKAVEGPPQWDALPKEAPWANVDQTKAPHIHSCSGPYLDPVHRRLPQACDAPFTRPSQIA